MKRYEMVLYENWSRYNEYCNSYIEAEPTDTGDWVRWEDVEALQCLNIEMIATLKRIRETGVFLGGIAHEMMESAITKADTMRGCHE
jgi:hypothetical protein